MHLRKLLSIFLVATTTSASAQETIGHCDLDSFRRNGLYYSPLGTEESAIRLELPFSRGVDQTKIISLTTRYKLQYETTGRFFLRSGAGRTTWLNLDTRLQDEAILVRRQTTSSEALPPNFISVFRSEIPDHICPKQNSGQFADESNFIPQGAFIRYHQDETSHRPTGELSRNFHFQFRDNNVICRRTDEPIDMNGQDGLPLIFNGDLYDVRTSGGKFIELAAIDIASVILPKPAYAEPKEELRIQREDATLNISSVEATLFHAEQGTELCLSWPAPIPTVEAGGFWARLFNNRDRHRDAAARMFDKGEWSPRVTEIYIHRLAAQSPAGLFRLYWH